VDDNVLDGLIRFNAPEDVIEAARHQKQGGEEEEAFEVWEENWTSLTFFLNYASTQWNAAIGMSRPTYFGLRYEGIESAMRITGVKAKERQSLFADLLVIEREVLPILNKPTEK
jgi:hypothetical protein